MKPKILFSLALVLSGLLSVCAGRVGDGLFTVTRADDDLLTVGEPGYLGKSLSRWIRLARPEGDLLIPEDRRANTAVQAIGTNALPCLLRWIHAANPETVRIGMEGFGLLGPIAKPAVPELMRQINGWRSSTAWSNAIPALAYMYETNYLPIAMTFLLAAATNADAPAEFRLRALQSIGEGRWNVKEVTPVLVLCLKDEDWRVVAAAAGALGYSSREPLTVVPALAACLTSHTNKPMGLAARVPDDNPLWPADVAMRNSAVSALAEFTYAAEAREAMRSAVPVLVNTLNDEDGRVAREAADAVGRLKFELDLVVPALVKCLDRTYRNDPYHHVQESAVLALGSFGAAAQAAVPALTKLAQTDPLGYKGGGFAAVALKKIVPQP
jgi:hypothetical protein